MANIRDLVDGWKAEPSPTLGDCARGFRTYYDPQGKSSYGHMPGDPIEAAEEFELDGPVSATRQANLLGAGVENPIPGMSALALSRALREGKIPAPQERVVRAYLAQWEKYTGEQLYNPRLHTLSVPENEEAGYSKIRKADPWGT